MHSEHCSLGHTCSREGGASWTKYPVKRNLIVPSLEVGISNLKKRLDKKCLRGKQNDLGKIKLRLIVCTFGKEKTLGSISNGTICFTNSSIRYSKKSYLKFATVVEHRASDT